MWGLSRWTRASFQAGEEMGTVRESPGYPRFEMFIRAARGGLVLCLRARCGPRVVPSTSRRPDDIGARDLLGLVWGAQRVAAASGPSECEQLAAWRPDTGRSRLWVSARLGQPLVPSLGPFSFK